MKNNKDLKIMMIKNKHHTHTQQQQQQHRNGLASKLYTERNE